MSGPRDLDPTLAAGSELASTAVGSLAVADVASAETAAASGSLPAAAAMPLPEIAEKWYVRLDEFARGGLGRIVRARDERTGRIVAIKEMLRETPDAAIRFVREALVTANLQHPAIVPVYEVGRWPNGQPFYAMKLVRGRPLNVVIDACTSVEARLALVPHVIAVADALAYAHGEHVIHRDLKPHNVLCGAHGETVVIDWGLARRFDEGDSLLPKLSDAAPGETVVGSVMGTPGYMAPEQARGERVDERADVYAIGALLYHVLAGKAPYLGKTAAELLDRVKSAPPPRLGDVVATVPPDLAAIVERAMARDPELRYPSAAELAVDLRRFSDGQLVRAHRYTRRERVRRFVARYRAAVMISAIAIVVLGAFAAISVHNIIASREAARSEKVAADLARDEASHGRTIATARLRAAYIDRARIELEADRVDRALPLISAAADLGATDAALRFVAARALDELIPLRRHPGAFIGALLVPGSSDLVLAGLGGVTRWAAEQDREVWSIPAPAGDLMLAEDRTLAATRPDGIAMLGIDDGRALYTLLPHAGTTIAGVLGGDISNRWLAAPTTDRKVDLWDVRTHSLAATIPIAGVDHSPGVSPDGTRLLLRIPVSRFVSSEAIVARDGRVIAKLCEPCTVATFTADSIAVATQKATTGPTTIDIVDWEGHRSVQLATITSSDIRDVQIDAAFVAVVAGDGTIEVWDRVHHTLRWSTTISDQVLMSKLDTRGRLWVLGTFNGVYGFDARTGLQIAHWSNMAGRWFAIANDQDVIAGITLSGAVVGRLGMPARVAVAPTDARVVSIAFAPDGALYAGAEDGVLAKLARDGREQFRTDAHHGKKIGTIALLPDGSVMTSARDGTTALWDPITHAEVLRLPDGPHAAPSPDGKIIATSSDDGPIVLWDRATRTKLRTLRALPPPLVGLRWSPDGRGLTAIGTDGAVVIWSSDGKELGTVPAAGLPIDVTISPDSRYLVRDAQEMRASLISLGEAAVPDRPLEGLPDDGGIFGSSFSADSRSVVIAGGGFIGVWDVATGKQRMYADTTSPVTGAVLSPDAAIVYSVGTDHTLRAWDVATGGLLAVVALPHEAYRVVITADGTRVAAGTLGAAAIVEVTSFTGDLATLHTLVDCRSTWKLGDAGRLVKHEIDAAACNHLDTIGR